MLFLLAMEHLHRLFQKAQELGILSKISPSCNSFRASLYVDDAAVIISPSPHVVQVTECILDIFAQASGLTTNLTKTEFFPIRFQGINLEFLSQHDRKISAFPCTYLGLPLHFKKLSRAMIFQLVQKIGDLLPGWKRNLLTYPGRELLVKTVLSSIPTYFLTVFRVPKWGFWKIDRFRRSFLWRGRDHENVRGGHCADMPKGQKSWRIGYKRS
jgi:hypothetical protein